MIIYSHGLAINAILHADFNALKLTMFYDIWHCALLLPYTIAHVAVDMFYNGALVPCFTKLVLPPADYLGNWIFWLILWCLGFGR
jgi:hypothetical protein